MSVEVYESRKEAYQAFLQTPFWKELSGRAKQISGFQCARCKRRQNLNSHHKIYRPNWEDTKLEDLIVLCRHCHLVEHGLAKPLPVKIIKTRPKKRRRNNKRIQQKKERRVQRKKKEAKTLALLKRFGPLVEPRPFVPGMYEGLTKSQVYRQIGRKK